MLKLLSNEQVALIQLERAILLFLDEQDYVSSLALAAASEEIFGELVNKQQEQLPEPDRVRQARDVYIDACLDQIRTYEAIIATKGVQPDYQHLTDGQLRKMIGAGLNYTRNRLKHYNYAENLLIGRSSAREIICRAVKNYLALKNTAQPTAIINRFFSESPDE